MDTSNSIQGNFRLNDLLYSGHSEDRELAQKAIQIVAAIVEQLKPILRYITIPVCLTDEEISFCKNPSSWVAGTSTKVFKLLEVDSADPQYPRYVFLDEGGDFFVATHCPYGGHFHDVDRNREAHWGNVAFDKLLSELQRVLTEAKQKREQHLESVTKRSAMMDDIMKIVEGQK